MCYDISFSTTIEDITDYLPDIVINGQLEFDFDTSVHILAQAHKKHPVIIFEDNNYKLKQFEWGVMPIT